MKPQLSETMVSSVTTGHQSIQHRDTPATLPPLFPFSQEWLIVIGVQRFFVDKHGHANNSHF